MTEPKTSRDPDICVVTCALTGVLANRKQCAGIPYTPAEIGEEAKRAYDAGAAVVHIHARHDDGSPTFSPAVFAKIREEVRKRCPIILNFSTGTILDDVSEQCTYMRETRPEIAALNMGTMNYSKYSKSRKSFVFDMVFSNTYEKIIKLLSAMNEAGVKPELECFDSGHTHGVWPLVDMGVLKPPLQYSFIVNVLGGIPPTVESLQLQTKLIVPGQRVGSHRHQSRSLAHARDGAGARRQHPHGPRGPSLLAPRRDGEVQRRDGRGRRSALPRRGTSARHRRGGAADPESSARVLA